MFRIQTRQHVIALGLYTRARAPLGFRYDTERLQIRESVIASISRINLLISFHYKYINLSSLLPNT